MPKTAPSESRDLVERRKRILAAIPGSIEPVPMTGRHRAAVLLVGGSLALLMFAFLMLAVLAAFGPIAGALFLPGLSHGVKIALFVGSGLGLVLMLFLIKPLYAPSAHSDPPRRLRREAEPLIYDYVERLCEAVGAPKPSSISIDTQVNASAGLRRGLASLFSGDMRLTIGLPLARGLTLRQFSGVLAHELGHFSQGTEMRINLLIRAFMVWLIRVVHERDAWDERLDEMVQSEGLPGLAASFFRGLVGLSRLSLSLLLKPAEMISCVLMRQMEFDADRHEVRVAGVNTFLQTSRRMIELDLAWHYAIAHLNQALEDGRLADDFASYVVAQVPQVPEKVRKEFRRRIAEERTSLFDTHPSVRERMASAREENTPGIFVPPTERETSATVLFVDYERLARAASLELYKAELEREIKPEELFPIDDLLRRQAIEQEAQQSARRFFRGMLSPERRLPVPEKPPPAPEDVKDAARRMKKAREDMLAAADEYRRHFKAFGEADGEVMASTARMSLARAGFSRDGTREDAEDLLDEQKEASRDAREALERSGRRMESFEKLGIVRLYAALQLLQVPEIRTRIEDGDVWLERVTELLQALRLTNGLVEDVQEMRRLRIGLVALMPYLENLQHGDVQLYRKICESIEDLRQRLQRLRKQLRETRYPLDHAQETMTMGQYVLPHFPEAQDLWGTLISVDEALRRLGLAHLRICGRLMTAAERVETALGLPELPDPPEEEDEDDEDDD